VTVSGKASSETCSAESKVVRTNRLRSPRFPNRGSAVASKKGRRR
jgi:hypothetical protein